MKEKYCYESVNDEIARHDVLLFISLVLFIFAFIKRESVSNKVFFALISISILMFVCWIGFFEMQGFFIAGDDAVTFGRIFKRRIDYSFTDVLVPYREYKSPCEPMAMYNNDWSNSVFSRLKNFIESNE